MKYLLATVLMAALVLAIGASSSHAQDAGAYSKAETDDSEVAAAANFAMKAREKALRKTDKDANVSLVGILNASKQVVAGINYKMLLKVNINYKDEVVEAVVWKKLSDDYELTTWNQVPEKKKESGVSR